MLYVRVAPPPFVFGTHVPQFCFTFSIIRGGRRSGDEKIIGKGGYDGVRSRENSSNSSSRGGGNAGGEKRKYDVSSRHGGEDLQKELDDALDHVKRLQIEKRQNERDVNNLKNEL